MAQAPDSPDKQHVSAPGTDNAVLRVRLHAALAFEYSEWARATEARLVAFLRVADPRRVAESGPLLAAYGLGKETFAAVASAESDHFWRDNTCAEVFGRAQSSRQSREANTAGTWQAGLATSAPFLFSASPDAVQAMKRRECEAVGVAWRWDGSDGGDGSSAEGRPSSSSAAVAEVLPTTRGALARRVEALFADAVRYFQTVEMESLRVDPPPATLFIFRSLLGGRPTSTGSPPQRHPPFWSGASPFRSAATDPSSSAVVVPGVPSAAAAEFYSPERHGPHSVRAAAQRDAAVYAAGALRPSGFDRFRDARCAVCGVECINPAELLRHVWRLHPHAANSVS